LQGQPINRFGFSLGDAMKISISRFLKRIAYFTILPVMSSFVLVGCGEKQIENLALVCEQLRAELKPLENISLLDRKLYYDGDAVATLLGEESRTQNKRFIYEQFPFMKTYTIEGIQSGEYEKGLNDYRIQAVLHFFNQTSYPIVIETKDEELINNTPDDGYSEVVEPKIIKIIGESYSDSGCEGLDSNNDVDFSERVEELFADGLQAAEESKSHLLGILLCERDGKIEGTACDKFDFVLPEYVPSNELTEEEKAILAEREANAEREAQNPPSSVQNPNVTPGQICANFGQMVQTESYGSLTCKFVWLNKIRALIWMRS
jgi:hypothetical protein